MEVGASFPEDVMRNLKRCFSRQNKATGEQGTACARPGKAQER